MQPDSRFFRAPGGRTIVFTVGLLLLVSPGCLRKHYHRKADRDAYNVLREKTFSRPWYLPGSYSVNADPRSRLFDPSNPNDPMLPHPGPHLYSYQLPLLSEPWDTAPDELEPLPPPLNEPPSGVLPEPAGNADRAGGAVRLASAEDDGSPSPSTPENAAEIERPGRPSDDVNGLHLFAPAVNNDAENADDSSSSPEPYAETEEDLTIQPIPGTYWDALPQECLSRMLEFETVRDEYRRTFETDPPEELRDPSPKLTFTNIVELAYLNSRDYQAQKEALYSAALALTLERYDYLCKFSAFGNGVDVNYDHVRTDGTTINFLGIPSSLDADKMIALGGTFVTQFANDVLLTFNGPGGFAEDITSTLLFEFTQSVFQRDVLLEPLILSERIVVYAARNFTRFRREFFFDLAQTYYEDLLSTYRQIEINTQNYFALVRALDQARKEVESGVGDAPPRVQIDQIEQDMLFGRSNLITSCNRLEQSLDNLKLTLGLPMETPININLRELETLTRQDEIEVAGELVRRAREQVDMQLSNAAPDREEIVSAAIVLLERMLDWLQRQRTTQDSTSHQELRTLRARFRVDETYEAVDRAESLLAVAKRPPAVPISVFRETMHVVQARLDLVARQLQLADELPEHTDQRDAVLNKFVALKEDNEAILARVARFLRGEKDEDLGPLQVDAVAMLQELKDLDAPARRMVGAPEARPDAQAELQQTARQARQLLETTERLASDAQRGMTPVDLSVDDAMATALVQRFELMNQRGFLADDWRLIKLAADDLKSVLRLNVRQLFRTPRNKPFAFSFDNSRTELRAALDLPLNRREQRNRFRQSLIDFQSGRRDLMAAEDIIKLEVRRDLRQLKVDRVQYDIDVVSAALASERVSSTQLELALGLATGTPVTARDFLEAQDAFRVNLSRVANRRFGYIVRRAELALNLELMLLDDAGFWPELNNEDYQPNFDPIYPFDAGPTFGELPHGVWPSRKVKRMRHAPLPGYQIIGVGPPVDVVGESETEDSETADYELPLPAGQGPELESASP
jgi:hypothetical protein